MQEYLQKLNSSQREAVMHINGPLLIIAGAGSGKTTVLINRVAYMIEQGVVPESILLLTFTNNAANNMVERAAKINDERCKNITACTYHSFCVKMLRKYGEVIGISSKFLIIPSSQVPDAIKLVRTRNLKYNVKGIPDNVTIAKIFSMMVNKQQTMAEIIQNNGLFSDYEPFLPLLQELLLDYRRYKKRNQSLDYDDLLLGMNMLLDNVTICEKIADTFRYIMVDEYQDTNAIQDEILMKISRKYQNIAVVGDDYQSIYRFRGANINNIINFPVRFQNCKQITIDTNYRSTKEILDVANGVMREHAHFGFSKQMKDANKQGKKVHMLCVDNDNIEADFVLELIKNRIKKGIPLKEIAVLTRNSKHSMNLEVLLMQEKIPFRKLGGLKFMDRACVLDMIALLKCVVNAQDELSWFRILDCIPGIGSVYANRLLQHYEEPDFLIHNEYTKKIFYPYLVEFYDILNKVRNTIDFDDQYQLLVDYYLQVKKQKIELKKYKDEGNRTADESKLKSDLEVLTILKDIALQYSTALAFIDSLLLDANPDTNESDNVITISTIHSAKGMEWNTVFILHCVDGVFPSGFSETTEEVNEDLRCFYVALTRAKEKMYILAPQFTRMGGSINYVSKSPFLAGCENYLKEKVIEKALPKKIYLQVSYEEKEEAKKYGAKWDSNVKLWYYEEGLNPNLFKKWAS